MVPGGPRARSATRHRGGCGRAAGTDGRRSAGSDCAWVEAECAACRFCAGLGERLRGVGGGFGGQRAPPPWLCYVPRVTPGVLAALPSPQRGRVRGARPFVVRQAHHEVVGGARCPVAFMTRCRSSLHGELVEPRRRGMMACDCLPATHPSVVMAGRDPAIHSMLRRDRVGPRVTPGGDVVGGMVGVPGLSWFDRLTTKSSVGSQEVLRSAALGSSVGSPRSPRTAVQRVVYGENSGWRAQSSMESNSDCRPWVSMVSPRGTRSHSGGYSARSC